MPLKLELINFCHEVGFDAAGVADLSTLKGQIATTPPDLLNSYSFGISVGIRLKDEIINKIKEQPTPEYATHYRAVNAQIDIGLDRIRQWIQSRGFRAEIIPASKVLGKDQLVGNLSHKAVARLAGLGWIGKSLLLIHPIWGPRMRWGTILTDMPLIPDNPLPNQCGSCIICTAACPVHAIKNVNTPDFYQNPNDGVNLSECLAKLRTFQQLPDINATICGICIRVCPFGWASKMKKKI